MVFAGSIYSGVIYSKHNIIYKEVWYEYIYDEAMNAIKDNCWAGHWIYDHFQRPVQAAEAKRLEKMAYLAMQRFLLIPLIPNRTYFSHYPLFRLDLSRWTH